MVELINELTWNHFFIIGFILILIDMLMFSIIFIILGISFIIVGLVDFFFEPSLTYLIITFLLSFTVFIIHWTRTLKTSQKARYKVERHNKYDHKDVRGTIIEIAPEFKIEFDDKIKGKKIWLVERDENLKLNERIRVKSMEKNLIKIRSL